MLNWEFENGTALLVKSEPAKELLDYGNSVNTKRPQIAAAAETVSATPEDLDGSVELTRKSNKTFTPNVLQCEAYAPSIVGLSKARRDCRLEMMKIVHEVDAVTADPSIALQPDRDWVYLSPAIFRQLLPVSYS